MSADPAVLDAAERHVEEDWLPVLDAYTRIPCLSPDFEAEWAKSGHLARATELLAGFARSRDLPGAMVDVVQLDGLTPVILVDVPASQGATAGAATPPTLLYGHLDKQPPLGDWRSGLGPFLPVREGDRLYGRGVADDGYSLFCALSAIELAAGLPGGHGRCVVIIEASEESGSAHLPAYLDELGDRLGPEGPGLVVCLDSGCLTYDRLWTTSSLRGLVAVVVKVEVLTEGVHSGAAGGVVPSSFRLLRRLISRVEDEATGEIRLAELHAEVPEARRREAEEVVGLLGDKAVDRYPALPGLRLSGGDTLDRLLARSWAPSLALVGMDGIPSVRDGGNVLRPFTACKLSIRVPPSVDARRAAARLREVLRAEPPEGATVTVEVTGESGFDAPPTAPWLEAAEQEASEAYFGNPPGVLGEGGTIPFLSTLLRRFPEAQFLVTGVLGEDSNAHGPNEMLHLPTAGRLTACVAHVLSRVP